jgi:hypothetical protein
MNNDNTPNAGFIAGGTALAGGLGYSLLQRQKAKQIAIAAARKKAVVRNLGTAVGVGVTSSLLGAGIARLTLPKIDTNLERAVGRVINPAQTVQSKAKVVIDSAAETHAAKEVQKHQQQYKSTFFDRLNENIANIGSTPDRVEESLSQKGIRREVGV